MPAQGKQGTSAALGIAFKNDKTLKGRDNLCAALSALFFLRFSQGVALG